MLAPNPRYSNSDGSPEREPARNNFSKTHAIIGGAICAVALELENIPAVSTFFKGIYALSRYGG